MFKNVYFVFPFNQWHYFKFGNDIIKDLCPEKKFKHMLYFQGGPYHELLQGLLGAYACYRPDVGYVSKPH